MGLIYKATSPSGKVYIGKTSKTLQERIASHKQDISRREYKNSKFYNAIRKYGFDSIIWEVLENIPDKNLDEIEIKTINEYDSFKNGLNTTKGGTGGYTMLHFTEEQMLEWKKNISRKLSGINNPMFGKKGRITGDKNPMKNPVVAIKIADFHKGRKRSEETRKKISEAAYKRDKESFIKRKDISFDGVCRVVFDMGLKSVNKTAKLLNCNRSTVRNRIFKRGFRNWSDFCLYIKYEGMNYG